MAQVHADDCKDKADRVIKAGTVEALKANIIRLRSEVRKGERESPTDDGWKAQHVTDV